MPFKNRMRNNTVVPTSNINAKIIKQRITMPNVISYYGFHTNRSGFMRCPFHNEKTPSLKIYPGGKGWYCYGCGAGGSVIDFVMKLFNINFSKAAAKLDLDFNLGLCTGPLTLRDKQRLKQKQEELKAQREYEQTLYEEYRVIYQTVAEKYRHLRQAKPPGYSAENPFGSPQAGPTQQLQPSHQFVEAKNLVDPSALLIIRLPVIQKMFWHAKIRTEY